MGSGKKDQVTSLGTNSGGWGKRGMNRDFRSSAILAISSSSFSNNLMAWVKVREPIKQNKINNSK